MSVRDWSKSDERCGSCEHFTANKLFAGGRCKFKGQMAVFSDLLCLCGKYIKKVADKPKPKPIPDESALGEDPQEEYS